MKCYSQWMYRIYFDGNDADEAGRYLLYLDRSRQDLAAIPGGPQEGTQVTIYMVGEIEMEATLEWNSKWNSWVAHPIKGTVRDNHDKWD
jgi:hypothetical protein